MTIRCLPLAGLENPYQFLMINGLRNSGNITVNPGARGKYFAIFRTALSDPDFIHVDWLHRYHIRRKFWMSCVQFPFFILEILLVKYVLKVKLVWTLHNLYPHGQKEVFIYTYARRFFARHCEWIRVFSSLTIPRASNALTVPNEKFIVLPEGDYRNYYPNEIGRLDARTSVLVRDEDFVLLFFGSIKKYKGIENLIEAYKRCSEDNWKLFIVGSCDSLSYIKDLMDLSNYSSSIRIIADTIPVDDVQIYMNACDIVVLPFEKIENSGSVILSMGFGKPIIAPKMGVLPDRLVSQPELLYEEDICEIFRTLPMYSKDELETIGLKNKMQLDKYKWSDFARLFK